MQPSEFWACTLREIHAILDFNAKYTGAAENKSKPLDKKQFLKDLANDAALGKISSVFHE